MPGDDDIIIICFGVGEVECKNTIPLPHYKNGIVTMAVDTHGMSPGKKAKLVEDLEKLAARAQKKIAKATGGDPYEFDEDVNVLPECLPAP